MKRQLRRHYNRISKTAESLNRTGLSSRRNIRLFVLTATVVMVCTVSGDVAYAQEPVSVMKVEEDWELEIGIPDPDVDGPQVLSVIAPECSIDECHAVFEMNHNTSPENWAGGMQIQHWHGEDVLGHKTKFEGQMLATPNELITYTMKMHLHDSDIHFEVKNGHSTTWGNFGGASLTLHSETDHTNLDCYNPLTSLKYSRASFASNRVKRFVLKEVRYYAADGTLIETVAGENINPPAN